MHNVELPEWTRKLFKCLHWSWPEPHDTELSAVLSFALLERRSFTEGGTPALLFPRGSVNALSLSHVFSLSGDPLGSGIRIERRGPMLLNTMSIVSFVPCANAHDASSSHFGFCSVKRPRKRIVALSHCADQQNTVVHSERQLTLSSSDSKFTIYRPLCPVFPEWTMTEAQGHSPKSSWGLELRSGHLHKDRYGRSPAPSASHRPVRQKRRAHSASSHASSSAQQSIPKWAGVPAVPQLRALEAQAAAIPISSSAASSASPRSGSSRVHPYPVGEAFEGSPFELVPSMATQAAQSSVQGGSMESTPVAEVAITS